MRALTLHQLKAYGLTALGWIAAALVGVGYGVPIGLRLLIDALTVPSW